VVEILPEKGLFSPKNELDLLFRDTNNQLTLTMNRLFLSLPPRIIEVPVSLECREWSTLEIGRNRMVIGLIDRIHTCDGILDPETLLVNPDKFAPIGRMEVPSGYCRTEDRSQMPRPE